MRRQVKQEIIPIISLFSRASLIIIAFVDHFLLLSYLLYIVMFERRTLIHISFLSMTRFSSLLRASLVVIFITCMVYNSDAATPYLNSATIFGSCADFAIQAGTSVAFNGVQSNVVSGSVGVAPGTSISGTPLLGTDYSNQAGTAPAISCTAAVAANYLFLDGVTCTNTLANANLMGVTLVPGVYCTGSGLLTLTAATLTLDAMGDPNAQFIFQTATTLITSANTNIVLVNGALAKNIFWKVGSSVTLGANSVFVGQIFAYASISVDTTVNVLGRLYAQAAVTFAGTDMITLPSQC